MDSRRLVIDNFLGGLAPSRYVGNPLNQADPGTNDDVSVGWDPFVSGDVGVLRRGYAEATITNVSLMQGSVQWMKTYNRSSQGVNDPGQYLFGVGTDENLVINRLYRVELNTHTVTNSSIFPHSLPTYGAGTGMEFYGGFLYYASGRYLGRYDCSLTFNDSFNVFLGTRALGDTIDHPMVQGNGKLFIGNSNFSLNQASIATVSGSTVNLQALDLSQTEQVVKALEFNRNYVYIALSSNSAANANASDCYLCIWDGVSSSWQDQFLFPDIDFQALQFHNGRLYCWGRYGFYLFTGSGFQLIYKFSGNTSPGGIDSSPNGILYFRDGATTMYGYGSTDPQIPEVIFRPYKSPAIWNGAIKWVSSTNLYASVQSGNRLRRFSSAGASDYNSAEWRTPMINFGERTRLTKIYVSFFAWPSGASMTLQWASGDGSSATNIGTINTADATSAEFYPNGMVADHWQLILNLTAATGGFTPKIRRIVIEYKPDKE